MPTLIAKLKGMSFELETKLKRLGIYNSDQLLEVARTPSDRITLADQVDLEPEVIQSLAYRADLARVSGIGGVFSDLLKHAGVVTVEDLACCVPDNLYAKLLEVNANRELSGRMPTLNMIQDWVAQAKELPGLLEH